VWVPGSRGACHGRAFARPLAWRATVIPIMSSKQAFLQFSGTPDPARLNAPCRFQLQLQVSSDLERELSAMKRQRAAGSGGRLPCKNTRRRRARTTDRHGSSRRSVRPQQSASPSGVSRERAFIEAARCRSGREREDDIAADMGFAIGQPLTR